MGGQDGARICQNDKRRISLTARLNDGMDLALALNSRNGLV